MRVLLLVIAVFFGGIAVLGSRDRPVVYDSHKSVPMTQLERWELNSHGFGPTHLNQTRRMLWPSIWAVKTELLRRSTNGGETEELQKQLKDLYRAWSTAQPAPIAAFPGAVGYGAYAMSNFGTTHHPTNDCRSRDINLVVVTVAADAVSQLEGLVGNSGYTFVIFQTHVYEPLGSGSIDLGGTSCVYIAGHTAPGMGVGWYQPEGFGPDPADEFGWGNGNFMMLP